MGPVGLLVAALLLSPPPQASAPLDPLLSSFGTELKKSNDRIERVALVELRAFPAPNTVACYLAIGWGLAAGPHGSGIMNDELFGVFVVDPSLSRVLKVLKVTPTSRFQDYELHVTSADVRNVVVTGRGLTYGDVPTRYRIPWEPCAPAE